MTFWSIFVGSTSTHSRNPNPDENCLAVSGAHFSRARSDLMFLQMVDLLLKAIRFCHGSTGQFSIYTKLRQQSE